jgi:hypothetical protein
MAVAGHNYAPFATGLGANTSEDTWRKFMRRPVVSGVIRSVLNEHLVYADSTGMQVKVKEGEVWLEGHWGTLTSEIILPVTTAHATLSRIDRVVARVDFVNDRVEYDVVAGVAGSGVGPTLTRNTSVWETSLAAITVPAAASTIAASNVADTRFFGGNVGYNVTDDLSMFGDKFSSCRRLDIQEATTPASNGDLFVVRLQANIEHNVSTLRMFLGGTAQVGGTMNVGIFKGFRQDDLQRLVSTTINLTTGTNSVREVTFTPITIEAGMQVVVAYLQLSATTGVTLGKSANVVSTSVLNPTSTVKSTVIKAGQSSIPTTMNLLDGTWTNRDRYTWVALA